MLKIALSLRYVTLIAAIGAGAGALMMIWEGVTDMAEAADGLLVGAERQVVINAIMHGVDAFLFGIVLVIFAYAIAFSFVFGPMMEGWQSLPSWMRVNDVSELKNTLVEVILLYLLVDVATDWAELESDLSWNFIVKPASIVVIAAAFGILKALHGRAADGDPPHG